MQIRCNGKGSHPKQVFANHEHLGIITKSRSLQPVIHLPLMRDLLLA